ncbi:MAG: hypothetical protein WBH44_00340 [Proteocatella sp.]
MTLLEILLFAITFTFLMAWGTIKKQRQSEELIAQLMHKSEKKIVTAFKKKHVLNQAELSQIITGTKGSLFWSKHKAVINDSKQFLEPILKKMIENGKIIEIRKKTYQWTEGVDL